MATKGLKMVTLALLDENGAIVKGEGGLSTNGVFPITDEMLGTKTANITNVSSAPTMIYGNDGQVDADIAKGTPSVAFDFNGLPVAIKNKLLGRVNDGKGGYTQGSVPKVAALIQTTTIGTGNPQYVGFAAGKMNETALNLQTNTNANVRVDDALTFTAFSVSRWAGEAIKFFDGGDVKFTEAAMMADVFNGYDSTTTTTTTSSTTTTTSHA
ncbi:tail protein [Lactococcus cremoris subsp. cremoris IBB477]|uniref:Tail protein n=1 Tax=Lactococcus cremoris subsp. cremoris IBB477 TaxID=1449093 RepID=A0A1E7G636_LACLC|nr:phage tail protein [Lactococcus cremoris]OEU40407.1 tail protein [Lactococcus cremoris subsp. cremoris IBB477]